MIKRLLATTFLLALCFASLAENGLILDESVFTLEEGAYQASLRQFYQGYENCKSKFKGTVYEKATSSCLKGNSSMSQGIAKALLKRKLIES